MIHLGAHTLKLNVCYVRAHAWHFHFPMVILENSDNQFLEIIYVIAL